MNIATTGVEIQVVYSWDLPAYPNIEVVDDSPSFIVKVNGSERANPFSASVNVINETTSDTALSCNEVASWTVPEVFARIELGKEDVSINE